MAWECTVTMVLIMIAMFIMISCLIWKLIYKRGYKYFLVSQIGPQDNNTVGWNIDETHIVLDHQEGGGRGGEEENNYNE